MAFTQPVDHKMSEAEKALMPQYLENIVSRGIVTPPDFPVRSAAEWEEMQGIVISWQSFSTVLTEIVRHAVEQGKVYIVTQSSSSVQSTLTNAGISTDSVVYVNEPSNTVWIRDYGPNNIYSNNVESLYFVDWVYNRPRPYDDAIPAALSTLMDVPMYETTTDPYELIGTGGNFMSDGFGLGFSSELIVDENPGHTEQEVRNILRDFMGIDEYVLMETLPYDGIHHIDMHMKLLDEETLLVGQYPDGVADGPQIEANLQYVLNNYQTVFGTPFKVVRIPMPPDAYGYYPNYGGDYRTYTNSLIFNKLVLVPIYGAASDDEALQIYEDAMPGYEVIGIDCNSTIGYSGAIHCITHELGANNPLLISHQALTTANASNLNHNVVAYLDHNSGIASANVMYRTDLNAAFEPIPMIQDQDSSTLWSVQLPIGIKDSITVQYYIKATAISGKEQVRPITAPQGYWTYKISNETNILPTANAGVDQIVDAGATVQLDGTASSDPNLDPLTYNWFTDAEITFDDHTLPEPSFVAPSFENDSTLEIFLIVSDGIGESISDTVLITVRGLNGVENVIVDSDWRVFPNPAAGKVYFAFDNQIPEIIRIIDVNGKVVFSDIPNNNYRVFGLNTSSFSSGLYLVQTIEKGKTSTKRLMIK
jgi:agmatine/peptidylarginine deiminase